MRMTQTSGFDTVHTVLQCILLNLILPREFQRTYLLRWLVINAIDELRDWVACIRLSLLQYDKSGLHIARGVIAL